MSTAASPSNPLKLGASQGRACLAATGLVVLQLVAGCAGGGSAATSRGGALAGNTDAAAAEGGAIFGDRDGSPSGSSSTGAADAGDAAGSDGGADEGDEGGQDDGSGASGLDGEGSVSAGDGAGTGTGTGAIDAGGCALVTQGTDYPGMRRTACAATGSHVAGAVQPGGPNVMVKDDGATVTLDNGIVTLVVTKATGEIDTWTYDGESMLAGGIDGGKVYWELQAGNGRYALTADPASNGGDVAEIRIHTTGSTNNLDVDIDYALLRGSSGFYATGILSHPAAYPASTPGEWRSNVYNGTIFDWLSVDAIRDKEACSPADWASSVAVPGAPQEVRLLTTGIYKGQYECKYSYSADLGDQDAWGWSSTTKNVGMWVTKPSGEYYNGGPKKRELMANIAVGPGPNLLNMLGGSHYLQSEVVETIPAGFAARKIYGPFFYYNNKVPAGTANAHDVLFADAIAQAKAEQAAWPYAWFHDTGPGSYVPESGRGAVSGTFAIGDPGAPHASAADMWIGLAPDDGVDPQYQFFTYQFWAKTGSDGSFTIPHVLPGTYGLWAFGPGAAGTFKRATDVTVAAGQKLDLGTVSWTPPRTAATVWEMGVPDRDSHEFLNGAYGYSLWPTSYVNYAAQFGKGVHYTVGTDDYARVWNYSMVGASTWTVNFTLAHAPTAASPARFYLALASSFGAHLSVAINGSPIGSFAPGAPSDAVVRLGSHGAFWDTSLPFNGGLLKAGANTLTITSAGGTLEWDYLRLEADGT